MALTSPGQRGGSGGPMVLIHGLAGAWRAWHEVAPRLADRCDVLPVRTVMPDVGHFAMWDDPALVADTVPRFTGQHAAAA